MAARMEAALQEKKKIAVADQAHDRLAKTNTVANKVSDQMVDWLNLHQDQAVEVQPTDRKSVV